MSSHGMEAGACWCDLDPVDVYQLKRPRARKEHRCDECHGTIRPGTHYAIVNSMCDGEWVHAKRCTPCQAIADDYLCGIVNPGMVHELAWEYLGVDLRTGETDLDDDDENEDD
jgi:hypothetical protein